MIRDVNDPRVAEILAAAEVARLPSPSGDEPNLFASFVDEVHGFVWTGWDVDAMHGVLVAYLVNAPDDDLDSMLESARGWLAWRSEFVLEHEFESAGLGSCYGDKFAAWKQTRMAVSA